MRISSQWCYFHYKSSSMLAVMQWSKVSLLSRLTSIYSDTSRWSFLSSQLSNNRSNNNNYEWIQWIESLFDHSNHLVVSNSVLSQRIVWNVSLCDYQRWWCFISISYLEDCQQLRFKFYRNVFFWLIWSW